MLNARPLDRLIRAFAGILLLELAAFWLAGTAQWLVFLMALVLLLTSMTGFCPLYHLIGIPTKNRSTALPSKGMTFAAGALLLLVLIGGSYASHVATRKLFLEDFNAMNDAYKQTLFLTGKAEREKANVQYARLVPALEIFINKYSQYQPVALRGDARLKNDFMQVTEIVTGVGAMIQSGGLHEAHLSLEKVRPVFQEIFKRNGFSMLAVALVDFHDAMELMLNAANDKDSAKLLALYPEVSEKLKAVEMEAQDPEIRAIRSHLDALEAIARSSQTEDLPNLGEKLKSSFVKVYLQRG